MTHSLISLYGKKRWIDAELVESLRGFDERGTIAAYRNAIRTLNHIFVVDQIFRAHLQGAAHDYTATNTKETPTLEALGAAVLESDDWYSKYVERIAVSDLNESVSFEFTDGDKGFMTREQILFHVLDHGTNHRGNIAQILKDANAVPPRDLFTKYLRLQREGLV